MQINSTWGWDGNSFGIPEIIAPHSANPTRTSTYLWLESLPTATPYAAQLVWTWHPSVPQLEGSLQLFAGGSWIEVDVIRYTTYAGTEPFGPVSTLWLVSNNPAPYNATVTLPVQWQP